MERRVVIIEDERDVSRLLEFNPLDAVGGQDRDTLAAEVTSHAFSSIPF